MLSTRWLLMLVLGLLVTAVHAAPPAEKKPAVDPFLKLEDGRVIEDVSEIAPSLTEENFNETVKSGKYYLVEFYSPYCIHCQMFAATWNQFYVNYKEELEKKDFHMAKVDCVAQGDLCGSYGIRGYPAMKLFENGEEQGPYNGANRKLASLKEFADRVVVGKFAISSSSSIEKAGSTPAAARDDKNKAADLAPTVTREFPQYPDSTEKVNTKYPAASIPPRKKLDSSQPNPEGLSVNLDHVEFTRRIVVSHDPWIIKFYSPLCPHCIALAPTWTQLARDLQGIINIGEVDCDRNSVLCEEVGVVGTPSIYFFEGQTHIPYEGLRGYGDLRRFADNVVEAASLKKVETVKELDGLISNAYETKPFIYFYDEATVSEDFEALTRVALRTYNIANYYKSNSQELIEHFGVKSFPALVAISDTKQHWTFYEEKGPKDMRDQDRLLLFVTESWLSTVPQLTPVTAKTIFEHSDYVVLAIVDPRDAKNLESALKEMKSTAATHLANVARQSKQEVDDLRNKKQLKLDEAKENGDKRAEDDAKKIKITKTKKPVVGFAWIDGVFWERWLKSRYGHDDVTRNRIIINQEVSGGARFWDTDPSGRTIGIGRSKIIDALEAVLLDQYRPKMTISGFTGYFSYATDFTKNHILLMLSIFISLTYYIYTKSTNRGGRKGLSNYGGSAPLDTGKLD